MSKWDEEYDWAEELPSDCPPDSAVPPQGEPYYRLAMSHPPTMEDFLSYRQLFPGRRFRTTECRARSCSVFSDIDSCAALSKLPAHRRKVVISVNLGPESGVVESTGRDRSHYSWWRSDGFDPVSVCKLAGKA